MKRIAKVEIGQRFRSIGVTGRPTYAYEVQAIFHSAVDRRDYARLVETIDRTRTKTIALATLVDPRHFQPLPAAIATPPAVSGEIERAA